jgi:hypothetical protein
VLDTVYWFLSSLRLKDKVRRELVLLELTKPELQMS